MHIKRGLFLVVALLMASATGAIAATLTVVNNTDENVDVNVDGTYGCSTDGHTSCTIPVSEGHHLLTASTATGASTSQEADIGAGGYTWTISYQ